jgi:hypothetical protein
MKGSCLVALAMMFAALACGTVGPIPAKQSGGSHSSVPAGGPTPDPAGPSLITIVVRGGVDAPSVARRIAGPNTAVYPAYQGPQENMPEVIRRNTYRVTIDQGYGCQALAKARSDPDVGSAYLGEYPSQYPDC